MVLLQSLWLSSFSIVFFFFNDTATTEIYTLSLHDALPILGAKRRQYQPKFWLVKPKLQPWRSEEHTSELQHITISYAVFCLKKKKKKNTTTNQNQQHTTTPNKQRPEPRT